jgi:hypothetical protein
MTTNFVNPEFPTGLTATPIPPSDIEQAAVKAQALDARYSPDRVAGRVKAIEAASQRTPDERCEFSPEALALVKSIRGR